MLFGQNVGVVSVTDASSVVYWLIYNCCALQSFRVNKLHDYLSYTADKSEREAVLLTLFGI